VTTREMPPLAHLGYVVENVDTDAALFTRHMGVMDFRIYDFVPLRAWADGTELSGCALRIAMGSIGNNVKVELIQPVSGETPHARFLRDRGPGLHHAAFSTADYDAWRGSYRDNGARIVFEAEAEDDIIGYRRCFYAQVNGMAGLVEFSEIGRRRNQP
jgi:methylmalonyl-CoA/ethylmalonyl-CoA epimerase